MSKILDVIKQAASKDMAGYQQSRKGRRPIRVHNLLKKASLPGQDMRLPVMGGVKFPTSDSKDFSNKLLEQSQSGAEKGSSPSLKSLSPGGPDIDEVIPKPPGAPDLMPKVGSVMTDPLVQYLSQQAKKVAAVLEDNIDDMPRNREEVEIQSSDPMPPEDLHSRGMGQYKSRLEEYFDSTLYRPKCREKDHDVEMPSGEAKVETNYDRPDDGSGLVDKILQKL